MQERNIAALKEARRNAAFAGWNAARGVAMWMDKGLPGFSEFYPEEEDDLPEEYTLEDHIQMMNEVGEGGPSL